MNGKILFVLFVLFFAAVFFYVGCLTPTGNHYTEPTIKPRYRTSEHRSAQIRVSDERVEMNQKKCNSGHGNHGRE